MSNTNSGLLGIKDIVFMNVIAILSLRQIPNVAPYGASAMLLWVIAAFCLFFPLAMVCGELSTGWPKDGGIFVWIKEAFGKRIAWIVVVCFLFSCVLFFPLMLQFGFTALGYMIGGGLAENKAFIGIGSAVIFWLLTLMNIRGMEWTKIINSISKAGNTSHSASLTVTVDTQIAINNIELVNDSGIPDDNLTNNVR
ncbi:APC family permease, partial [Salmonella enterica subsp. enterica serovar Montevideo]|nr:APC family permease [Salmonella enterica subsp. enterica serovar Montevideo]